MLRIIRCLKTPRLLSSSSSSSSVSAKSLLTRPSIPFQIRLNSTEQSAYQLINVLKGKSTQNNGGGSLDLTNVTRNIEKSKKPVILQSNINYTAKSVAEQLRVTGPTAGKIVRVFNGDVTSAYRRLKTIININNIRVEKQAQRFHKKPGKVLEEKRIRRKKKLFNEGVRRLMNLVREAKRRGY